MLKSSPELEWFRRGQVGNRSGCRFDSGMGLIGHPVNCKESIMPTTLSNSRLTAFMRQKGRCYYCNYPMWLGTPDAFAARFSISKSAALQFQCTAEHLLARKDGGKDSPENIVAACKYCNKTRHYAKSPSEPIKHRMRVIRRLGLGKWHPKEFRHLLATSR